MVYIDRESNAALFVLFVDAGAAGAAAAGAAAAEATTTAVAVPRLRTRHRYIVEDGTEPITRYGSK